MINSDRKYLYSVVACIVSALILVTTAYAVPEEAVKLYIYDDGVVLVGNITVSNTSNRTGILKAIINTTETSTRVEFYFNGTASPSNTQKIRDFELSIFTSTTKEDKYITTRLKGYLTISGNETGFLRADYNATYVLDQKQCNATIKGEANLQASGQAAAIFLYLGFLNKNVIEQYLEKFGIKGIKINGLTTTVSGNKANIKFDVEINFKQLMNSTNITSMPGIKFNYSNLTFIPGKTDLKLSVKNKKVMLNMTITADSDINTLLKNIATLLTNIETYIQQQNTSPETRKAMDIFIEFTKKFNIKPSNGYITITADPENVEVSFKTPKIISKNGDLNQTLKDIITLIEQVPASEKIEEAKIEIHPQENVKITMNNQTPTNISLRELALLTVTVTKTTTSQGNIATGLGGNLLYVGIGAAVVVILLVLVIAFSKKK